MINLKFLATSTNVRWLDRAYKIAPRMQKQVLLFNHRYTTFPADQNRCFESRTNCFSKAEPNCWPKIAQPKNIGSTATFYKIQSLTSEKQSYRLILLSLFGYFQNVEQSLSCQAGRP